jgi:serine/threonine protein kinase/Tol biopolymer transport system component
VKKGPSINPDRWPDISRVFSAAANLDGPSRHAYLDDVCRQDPALRAAVESLLGAHDNAGSFGETPVIAPIGTARRLAPGSQLGPFRIEDWLGAGGMGEVYRAQDTKLQRAVAIKVLPDFFAQDPNRLARFEEEARALAALNHPHIGAIYGLEESAGIVALVLELVEGPTLAERLAVGPLAFDEVVWITRQLADGLEAAHEHGIVHRDLKPANIKITPDGNVKILDFGLAKTAGSPPGAALTPSTTSPREATQFGMVLGTVGYMSPEQARGQAVDKRTDIWAFGCVLFEMCARQPPFAGATISDAQAAVIEREPDWELLRAGTPANLVRLLHRCLTKDPKLRLRDIGEARIALEQDTDTADVAPRSDRRRVAAIAAILATATSFAIAFAIFGSPRWGPSVSPSPGIRFPVPPPEGTLFDVNLSRTFFALSPDGLQLAFVAGPAPGSTGPSRVWVRALAEPGAGPLLGTEGATSVFWSPDGQSLAFFAARQLKRIALRDRTVVKICDVDAFFFNHGTWGAGGVILLGGTGASIDVVSAAGGTPVPILPTNQSKGEARVHWPWFLPDGKRFLYTARLDDGEGEVRLAQLRRNDREGNAGPVQLEEGTRTVMRASSNAQWVDPDVVVFVREGVLMAQRVDVEAGRPLAEPFAMADPVGYFFTSSRGMFSASRTGSVAYHSGQNIGQLVWADRKGNEVGMIGNPAGYESSARLSPDDSALLVARTRAGLGTHDIWKMNLVRGNEERLTSNRGSEVSPVWIADGRAMLFAGDSAGQLPHLFRKDLATGAEEQVLPPGNHQLAMDVFPDGRVAYVERGAGGFSLFQPPLARRASPTPLLPGRHVNAYNTRLSPDGRAMSFVTGGIEGRMDVYVSTVPVTSAPELVAEGVSSSARWSRDGSRIYYVSRDGTMMTLAVGAVPPLTAGAPEPLFKLRRAATLQDVFRDGRFLLLVPQVRAGEHPITVWTSAIASTKR